MTKLGLTMVAVSLASAGFTSPAFAVDQTVPGAGNVALAHLSAERPYIKYTSGGLDAVRGQLSRLRSRGII